MTFVVGAAEILAGAGEPLPASRPWHLQPINVYGFSFPLWNKGRGEKVILLFVFFFFSVSCGSGGCCASAAHTEGAFPCDLLF